MIQEIDTSAFHEYSGHAVDCDLRSAAVANSPVCIDGYYNFFVSANYDTTNDQWHYTKPTYFPGRPVCSCYEGERAFIYTTAGELIVMSKNDYNEIELDSVALDVQPRIEWSAAICASQSYLYLVIETSHVTKLGYCAISEVLNRESWQFTDLFTYSIEQSVVRGIDDVEFVGERIYLFYSASRADYNTLSYLYSTTQKPTNSSKWLTGIVDQSKNGFTNVNALAVDGKPAVSYIDYDQRRLVYAYARNNPPRSSKDWYICTVWQEDRITHLDWIKYVMLVLAAIALVAGGVWLLIKRARNLKGVLE